MTMYGPINFFEELEGGIYVNHVDEIIELYGVSCYYIPRNFVNEDTLLGENDLSTFTNKYELKVFIKEVDGFAGIGDFYSKFGLYSPDEATLEISENQFKIATELSKPYIGDLIILPWTKPKTIYEINFVETESPFYHLGRVPIFDLSIKRWQYSRETFTADSDLKDIINNVEDNEDFMADNNDLIESGDDLIE